MPRPRKPASPFRCFNSSIEVILLVVMTYVRSRTRDKATALAFMKRTLKRHRSPEAVTTDGLHSYKAAMSELGKAEKREIGCWANNRAQNSQ